MLCKQRAELEAPQVMDEVPALELSPGAPFPMCCTGNPKSLNFSFADLCNCHVVGVFDVCLIFKCHLM